MIYCAKAEFGQIPRSFSLNSDSIRLKRSKNLTQIGFRSLRSVKSDRLLEDSERIIKLIDIGPTAHSQHILVAWLPGEKILFQADHFNIPNNRNITPAVSATKSFASALKAHGIKPQHILSAHSPHTGTMKDLTAALEMADKL